MQSSTKNSIKLAWWIGLIVIIIYFHKQASMLVALMILYGLFYIFVDIVTGPVEKRNIVYHDTPPAEIHPEKIDTIQWLLKYYSTEEVASWCVYNWQWSSEHATKVVESVKNSKID